QASGEANVSTIVRRRTRALQNAVTTFSTTSRAPLRRARPDGQGRGGRGRTRAVGEEERPGRPVVGGRGSPGVPPLRGGSFAASFGREPYGAATAAHGTPGDRPPAVPAVSRCRADQHHHQDVTLASTPANRRENVTPIRPERPAQSGAAPPASRAPEDRF